MIIDQNGETAIVTVEANKAGKNLQPWNQNLLLTIPASGATQEQLIGRTHRSGQTEKVIVEYVCAHESHHRALAEAFKDARLQDDLQTLTPKLLLAEGNIGKERGE